MNKHTVVQLKAIAKDRGIRSYYKLRKAELIHARLVEQTSNIFDESIPNDPTPVLEPKSWRSSNNATKNITKFIPNGMQQIKDFW